MRIIFIGVAVLLLSVAAIVGLLQVDSIRYRYERGPDGFLYKIDRINGDTYLLYTGGLKKIYPR